MSDEIEDRLRDLKADLPQPRLNLSTTEKRQLIAKLGGPKTALSLLKAKKDFPLERIPFLYSSLDTQAVVDFLANDMESLVKKSNV